MAHKGCGHVSQEKDNGHYRQVMVTMGRQWSVWLQSSACSVCMITHNGHLSQTTPDHLQLMSHTKLLTRLHGLCKTGQIIAHRILTGMLSIHNAHIKCLVIINNAHIKYPVIIHNIHIKCLVIIHNAHIKCLVIIYNAHIKCLVIIHNVHIKCLVIIYNAHIKCMSVYT